MYNRFASKRFLKDFKREHMSKKKAPRKPVSPWVERLARFGYATKGAVYIIVGILATLAAVGMGGRTTDSQGVFQEIFSKPFGQFLISAVTVGLVGYVIWRFAAAFFDTEGKGNELKGIAIRGGYAFSGLIHAGLAWSAARLALGSGGADSGKREQKDWTARVLELPLGPWLVSLVGVGFICFGLYQIYKGFKYKFRKRIEVQKMSSAEERWTKRIGKIGFTARGIVFNIIGYFLIRAAINHNPEEVRGLDGALGALAEQPFGKALLGIVAAGLIAYGFYMFIEARYHRIRAT
jgi:hypothetical protein